MRPPKKRKAPLLDRIVALKSRRRATPAAPQNGQQEPAEPEKLADGDDVFVMEFVMKDPEQDEAFLHDLTKALEQDAGASGEQVESESRRDLAHRSNDDQAEARWRPAPKSKQTARSQRIQSMLDLQQQASCQRSFDSAGSEAPPQRQRSAKDTGTDKDHGKGTTGVAG